MQELVALWFQSLMKKKCDPLMISMFLVNLKHLQVTSQKLARGKLVHLHGRRSLALLVLAQVD